MVVKGNPDRKKKTRQRSNDYDDGDDGNNDVDCDGDSDSNDDDLTNELQISFLCYYLECDVKLRYLNGDPEISIFHTDLTEAVDTTYVVSLIINEEFDNDVVCHRNQIKPEQNFCFIIQKSSLNHQKHVFSDDMGRWKRSQIKHLKYGESVDNSLEKVLDENEEEYNKIWNIKVCIHCHHENRDFHRVINYIYRAKRFHFCTVLF